MHSTALRKANHDHWSSIIDPNAKRHAILPFARLFEKLIRSTSELTSNKHHLNIIYRVANQSKWSSFGLSDDQGLFDFEWIINLINWFINNLATRSGRVNTLRLQTCVRPSDRHSVIVPTFDTVAKLAVLMFQSSNRFYWADFIGQAN